MAACRCGGTTRVARFAPHYGGRSRGDLVDVPCLAASRVRCFRTAGTSDFLLPVAFDDQFANEPVAGQMCFGSNKGSKIEFAGQCPSPLCAGLAPYPTPSHRATGSCQRAPVHWPWTPHRQGSGSRQGKRTSGLRRAAGSLTLAQAKSVQHQFS
jgi:hypothetical protein